MLDNNTVNVEYSSQCKPLLKMRGITKTFPGVQALRKVDFDLNSAEVHVLIGENGAGKSTLMKVLSGNYVPDEGEIFIDDKLIKINSPHIGQCLGITMIHQEMMLAENVTVTQNIFMGREIVKSKPFSFLDMRKMNKKASEILNGVLNANIQVTTKVNDLSVAQKQLVEIARALLSQARIIIMDEPTSSLTDKDIHTLFKIIQQLREKGTAVIYITHRMEEIVQIADKVTVMRDGEHIATQFMNETTIEQLIKMMVGRNLEDKFPKRKSMPSDIALSVKNISRKGVLKDISFVSRKGEVLGIFGLIGSGRTELVKAIFGADRIDSGEIEVYGKKVNIKSPRDAIRLGIGLVPEDRKLEGLVGILSVAHNTTLPIIDKLKTWIFVNLLKQRAITTEYINALSIKTPNMDQAVRHLSGGNQQKVVIAKWLASKTSIIIFDEPTRGIDVGAKIEIYKIMNELLEQGKSIVMISSEMPELLGVSDRILIMREGAIVAESDCINASCEEILKCAL